MPMLFELYYKKDTFIHNLDPRIKIMGFAAIVLISFLFNHPKYTGTIFLLVLVIVALARVPRNRLRLLLLPQIYIFLTTFIVWTVFFRSGTVVLKLWIFRFTDKGITIGMGMGFRLISIFTISGLFPMVISQRELIESLRSFKVPPHFILATVITLRFIPSILGEFKTVEEAQKARALEIKTGVPITPSRIKGYINYIYSIMIPTMTRALIYTQNVAITLESKALSLEKMKEFSYMQLKMKGKDKITAAMLIAMITFCIALRVMGFGWIPMG